MPGEPRPSDLDHIRWLNRLGLAHWQDAAFLDLGCGSGFLCQEAVRLGSRVAVGIDLVPPGMSDASWQFMPVDLDAPDWIAAPLSAASGFDLVTAFDIFEHLRSPWDFLANMRQILKPRGVVVLTTPNVNSWERLAKPKRWSGASDLQHKVLMTRYSLEFMLLRAGFEIVSLTAPLRKLEWFGPLCPNFGGQIIAVAKLA